MKIDLEHLAFKFTEYIEANLNAKITAINSEKNDGITLSAINSNAFYYEQEEDSYGNYDVIVTFVIDSSIQETNAAQTSEQVEISIYILFPTQLDASSKNQLKKAFRYRRALLDVIKDTRKTYHALKVNNIPAMPLVSAQTNREYLAIGLDVSFNFANA